MRSGFAGFMGWAAAVLGAITVADAAALRAPASVLALDLLCLALVVAAWAAFARGMLGARASNPVATILIGALVVNTIVSMRVSGDLSFTLHIAVEVLVASSLMTSALWLLASGGATVAAWMLLSPIESASSEMVQLIGLAASVALGVVMLRHRMKLLDRVIKAAQEAEAGRTKAEAALARATEEMNARERAETERESLRGQFLHAQKMEGIGTLAAGVVHDMNNVLSAATTLGAVIRDQVSGATRDDVDNLLLTLQRGTELTSCLLDYSRKPNDAAPPEPAVVRSAVESVVRLVRRTLPKAITVEVDPSNPKLTVACDPAQLSHALLNLCINASDAMNGKGHIHVATRAEQVDGRAAERLAIAPGEYVVISVKDTGCGMDEETRRRATEPFFTTKGAKGSGLGLAMVSGTMRNHGGAATIESAPAVGTVVSLYLPRAADVTAVRLLPPSDPEVPAVARQHQLLVVDDDGLARRAARRLLERLGYAVAEAADGEEALREYREKGPFDVVLLDVAMPKMDGLECLIKLKEFDPRANVVMFSSTTSERERTMTAGAAAFVPKPLVLAELDRAISACLDQTN